MPQKKILSLDDKVEAYVTKISSEGIKCVTFDFNVIFIHKNLLRGEHNIGQKINVIITKILDDLKYYGKGIENKENMIGSDASIIISYLVSHNGIMNLTADSNATLVYDTLKMSRKAFKRALGDLYKKRIVDFKDDKTILIKGEIYG